MNNLEKETMEMAKRAARKYVYDEIDWERRRYEIAKEMLPVINYVDERSENELYGGDIKDICEEAIKFADELIKQLKGEE